MDLEGIMLSEIKSDRETQIPSNFTYMWNRKNKRNEHTKQKQTHRCREQTDGCQRGGRWWLSEKGEGIKNYKLAVTKYSQACKVRHREYSH